MSTPIPVRPRCSGLCAVHCRTSPRPVFKHARLAVLGAVLAVGLTAAGCARKSNGTIDAPLARQDNTPAYIINMPNAWRNVATKCDVWQPGFRLYETRSNGNTPSLLLVIPDKNC